MLEQHFRYIDNITSGAVPACEYIKQAIERHCNDLLRQNTEEFPYYFDESKAERALLFVSKLKHTKGEWHRKPFEIQDHQAFRIASIFGWQRTGGGRRFRRCYIEIPRKNGKSEEAAAIGLVGLLADNEGGAQVITAATTRDQARIVFESAQSMARMLSNDSAVVKKALQIQSNSLKYLPNESSFFPVSSEAKNLDGKNPHIAIIDEYHAHPNSDVLKVLETGFGARRSPLLFIITTAGFNLESTCYQYRDVCIRVLSGALVDEQLFTTIYTLDDGDDWQDEKVWGKANPNLGITPTWDFMRAQARAAINEGESAKAEFLTKNLNVWVRASKGWITDHHWLECGGQIDLERLKGLKCYGGFDLSSTYDYCAMCLLFPEGEKRTALWWFWLCRESYEKRIKTMPIMADWVKAGYLDVVDGNHLSQDYLEAAIVKICGEFKMIKGGADPYYCWDLLGKLQNKYGLPIESYRQSFQMMSEPIRKVEELVSSASLNHGDNPIARWMLGNASVKTNSGGGRMLDKSAKAASIDGIISLLIAEGVYAASPERKESYLTSLDLITF